MLDKTAKIIATFFYVGLAPKAPGTVGSAAAIALAYLTIYAALHIGAGMRDIFISLLFCTCSFIVAGHMATVKYMRNTGSHDPKEVVIDEVAGVFLACTICCAYPLGVQLWESCLLIFLLFRFFDIVKPWPVSWADGMSHPFGVMLDDLLAGVYSAVIYIAIALLV